MIKRVSCLGMFAALGVLIAIPAVHAADKPASAPAEGQDAAKAGAEAGKEDKSVVIQGVQRLRVKMDKPEPDLSFDVDEIAIPYVKTEDDVLDVSPTSMAYPAVSVPSTLASTQTASPFIQLFQRAPILKLAPRFNNQIGISNWRLRITDGFGNVFKDFAGNGSLPRQIIWDGVGKDNEMLDVGTSYAYIFSVVDVASNPTSQMGKPIILESLMYEAQGETIAKVVSSVFFTKEGRKTEISPKGKLYMREISDLLMARQNYPLVIETYAKDVDDANTKGEMIQEYLAEHLTLPMDRFKISPQKANLEKVVFKIH